jgi:hypothetical protein
MLSHLFGLVLRINLTSNKNYKEINFSTKNLLVVFLFIIKESFKFCATVLSQKYLGHDIRPLNEYKIEVDTLVLVKLM